MNENELTDEQLEEMTNPFAEVVDTNGDGEISADELDNAVNNLADLENDDQVTEVPDVSSDPKTVIDPTAVPSQPSALELVRQAERNTISDADRLKTAQSETEIVEAKDKVDTTGKPTTEKLDALGLKDDRQRSHHCQTYADSNNLYFLGFCIKTDEPLFKDKA